MEIKNPSIKYEFIVWAQTRTDVNVNRVALYLGWERFVPSLGESACLIKNESWMNRICNDGRRDGNQQEFGVGEHR